MKAPNLFTLNTLRYITDSAQAQIDGEWVPARPMGLDTLTERVRLAWGVLIGRYDALKWPKGQ